jgi:16S rRNA (cytosine1402-N4)-methyltransferase
MQLDSDERGFAYSRDVPLDMRMDGGASDISARELIEQCTVEELTAIIKDNSGERYSLAIARGIKGGGVAQASAQERPLSGAVAIATTGQLADVIRASLPARAKADALSSIKRVFQALRIAVNGELESLEAALPKAIQLLTPGGRIAVLSYHSLEDKIVKARFNRGLAELIDAQYTSQGLPFNPEQAQRPYLKLLTRGEKATPEEIATNSRANSVRLRAVQKIRELEGGEQV